MKITKTQLKQIIKEELDTVINEATTPENLVSAIWRANNALVDIISSIDDENLKQRLHDVRALITDTAADYEGIGGPPEKYGAALGGQGGH